MIKTFGLPQPTGTFGLSGAQTSVSYIDKRIVSPFSSIPVILGNVFFFMSIDMESIGQGIEGNISFQVSSGTAPSPIPFIIYPDAETGFSYIGSTRVQ